MTKNSALKVAVIGGGNIAQQHLPVLKDLPEADVVALADANPKVLQESADRFAIPNRWSSHMELLEEDRPDAVFVLVSVEHGRDAHLFARFLYGHPPAPGRGSRSH